MLSVKDTKQHVSDRPRKLRNMHAGTFNDQQCQLMRESEQLRRAQFAATLCVRALSGEGQKVAALRYDALRGRRIKYSYSQ